MPPEVAPAKGWTLQSLRARVTTPMRKAAICPSFGSKSLSAMTAMCNMDEFSKRNSVDTFENMLTRCLTVHSIGQIDAMLIRVHHSKKTSMHILRFGCVSQFTINTQSQSYQKIQCVHCWSMRRLLPFRLSKKCKSQTRACFGLHTSIAIATDSNSKSGSVIAHEEFAVIGVIHTVELDQTTMRLFVLQGKAKIVHQGERREGCWQVHPFQAVPSVERTSRHQAKPLSVSSGF